jgi:RNA polymerase sigma-70 factor (ECF subfamily)
VTRRLFALAFPFIEDVDATAGEGSAWGTSDDTLQMDEDTFRGFYGRTSIMLWAYLSRATGDAHAADDLLQETYYRFLRAHVTFDSDEHRRHYLFRIATNLVRDRYRRPRHDDRPLRGGGPGEPAAAGDLAQQTQQRTDLQRAMAKLTDRERDLVWLAYGQGSSHEEIAGVLGLKTGSIKPLLYRARRKLVKLLSR